MSDNRIVEVPINKIKIGKRTRKEIGDIEVLAENIKDTGLLQPVGITSDFRLVFGERRLRAYMLLGHEAIPARIVDLDNILLGQFTENLMRKEYTVSERVSLVEALRSFKHGGDRRSKQVRKCDDEAVTVDDAAKRAGLGGKDSFVRAKTVVDNGIHELMEAMDAGQLSISAAATLAEATHEEQAECLSKRLDENRWTANGIQRSLKRIRSARARQAADAQAVETPSNKDAIQIYHCPFQKLERLAGLKPESVNLICTDIPYGKEFLADLEDLAKLAQRVLVKGGLFLTYSGQFWLDDVMQVIRKHLDYRWTLASVWRGAGTTIHPRNAVSKWKPILLYSKGKWESRGRWPDLLQVDSREKQYHDWQQPLEEVERLVRYFSNSGDLVVDPCGGGFTTAVACRNLGRQFVGCDIDKAAVVKGQERLRVETDVLPIGKAKPVRINTVVNGDCRQLIRGLPDGAVNLCLTSPPYAEQRKGLYPGVPANEYPQFTVEWMSRLWDKLADDGSVLIIIDAHVKKGVMSDYVRRTEDALCDFGWKQHRTQVWLKRDRAPLGHKGWPRHCSENILWFSKTADPFCDPWSCGQPSDRLSIARIRNSRWSPGGKQKKSGVARVPDVIDVPVGSNESGIDHPAMFPVELAERLIPTFCPPGGVVLDPFAGSGSTLIAAKKLGCDYYGFDVVGDYCKIARKRLAATTGNKTKSDAG